ncbi:stage III sporulation protein AE [Clostridium thermobutyricum]|uniref:Stage III sporulation protein AE n=1 Tax=Clostridium thermobutyricum DSM 4928 TaxID=1121339 RepID=A0A1V4SV80_9CLOT|nr:stage III sporulation protein AE [Clostridium thermobutyricum]OPX47879.1 stage III sporulation protein AE precursor [Clostridium thermobutyricum DSM 4928]
MFRKDLRKKFFILLISSILIQIFIPCMTKAFANEETKEKNLIESSEEMKLETDNKLNSLYDYINKMKTDEELLNELDPKSYVESYIKNGQGNLTIKELGLIAVNLLFKEVRVVLKLVISVVAIAILCSLLKNLEDAFKNESISNIAFYACYSVLIIILSRSFLISIDVATNVINSISEFMNALLPVLVGMIALAGGFVQAATMDPIVLGSVILIPKIYSNFIIPMILVSFVLKFANNLSTEHKIDNLCKLVSQGILWFQGIIITVFIAMLTIRGITADTMDAVALKTTKFAVDNFVPIVGKAFSDAITSVAGYSLIIKNAITGIGLIVIVLIILYPIIKLVLMTFIYKISASLVEPISDKRITSALSMIGESMVLLTSCVISVSFMFFILLGIMASAGKFVVGG